MKENGIDALAQEGHRVIGQGSGSGGGIGAEQGFAVSAHAVVHAGHVEVIQGSIVGTADVNGGDGIWP